MESRTKEEAMTFNELKLPGEFLALLEKHQIIHPYPIQEQVIPAILAGKDLLGIAKTGSGKTLSFVLPILVNLQKQELLKNRHIQTLVLVPTRELAMQVNDVFATYKQAAAADIKTLAVFGGASINPQMMALRNVNILVATPGRLLELLSVHAVHLSSVATLVLDEADKLLLPGFGNEINQILALLPEKRQNLLFSATLNADIAALQHNLLNDPLVLAPVECETDLEHIKQSVYAVA